VFNSVLNGTTNVDKVMDFNHGESDKLYLSASFFTALAGGLTVDELLVGAGATTASTANQHLIYNTTTGNLYYDADGAGGAAAIQFATLNLNGVATSHPATLTESDFWIV
jgi:Ca2+-binding RTX toxin-like protein